MNRKPFVFLCLLLGLLLFVSSCDAYRNPNAGKINYMSIIAIDSTASACDVDSCAIKLPWLNDEINVFLADSAKRRISFRSTLRIDRVVCKNTENEDITYFRYEMYSDVKNGSLWFGCEGDTVWIDTTWEDRSGVGVIKSDKTEDFNEVLDRNGSIRDGENIVEIVYGYLPPI